MSEIVHIFIASSLENGVMYFVVNSLKEIVICTTFQTTFPMFYYSLSVPVFSLQDEGGDESTKNVPPWKLELMKKKQHQQQQPKLAPKPAGKPKPGVASESNRRLGPCPGGGGSFTAGVFTDVYTISPLGHIIVYSASI